MTVRGTGSQKNGGWRIRVRTEALSFIGARQSGSIRRCSLGDAGAMTPFEAEVEAERRWSGWSAKARRTGEWFAITMSPLPQDGAAVVRLAGDPVGRSREGFVEALEALGPRP